MKKEIEENSGNGNLTASPRGKYSATKLPWMTYECTLGHETN
jgi:hypothetical protein